MGENSFFILVFLPLPQLFQNTFSKHISQGGQNGDILNSPLLAYLPMLGVLISLSTNLSFSFHAC